jgi:glucosamine-6-phosphate deaminase
MAPMRIEIVADERALGLRAAAIVFEAIAQKPNAVLGLPTGDTPTAAYAELRQRVERGDSDARNVQGFAIDEFIDVAFAGRGTNAAFFAAHLHFLLPRLSLPDSGTPLPEREIALFANELRAAGGFDLCVLGIGANGHIAFNEPGSGLDSRARVVELAEESRRAHAVAFGSLDAVPRRGVTLGVADILDSRAILVLAQGAAKAAIVALAIEGPQTADVPASWLQTHADVTWLLDEAAGALLHRR